MRATVQLSNILKNPEFVSIKDEEVGKAALKLLECLDSDLENSGFVFSDETDEAMDALDEAIVGDVDEVEEKDTEVSEDEDEDEDEVEVIEDDDLEEDEEIDPKNLRD